jgi:hypothetical protein
MFRLITAAELRGRTLSDLQDLYRTVEAELIRSPRGSAQRRNALASPENIARAIAKMRACQLRPR